MQVCESVPGVELCEAVGDVGYAYPVRTVALGKAEIGAFCTYLRATVVF